VSQAPAERADFCCEVLGLAQILGAVGGLEDALTMSNFTLRMPIALFVDGWLSLLMTRKVTKDAV